MQVLPKRRRYSPLTSIENLEIRNLLSGIMSAAIPEAESNDTLDQSMDLGSSGSAAVEGTIDRHGVDVDWYTFTLLVASEVTLDSSSGTVGLYNHAPGDLQDRLNPFGTRLLAQATAEDSTGVTITRSLAAGTYSIAVSGKGNSYFHPDLADSGLAGETGDYTLEFTSTALMGPVSGDPLPLAIDASPLGVRIDFGGALNFSPAVELVDSQGTAISLSWTNYSSTINELQFAPNRALTAGDYTAVIKDTTGTVRMTLQVHVPEVADIPADSGDDTPATAIDLGELDALGIIQVPGIIGDDPYYDSSSVAPGQHPGNDVDLYHFHISSSSTVGFQAEVFAGRIGSNLNSGVSLYRLDPVSGNLIFVAGNNQTYNPIQSSSEHLTQPLYTDSILGAGLVAGDYYLAVSDGANTQSPVESQLPGSGSGIFDPEQSHSGTAGTTTGAYVVQMRLVSIADLPEVVSVSIADQSTLATAPTELTIQFNQSVNISQLAKIAYINSSQNTVAGISIQDGQGHVYYPRLTGYDATTFTAYFIMSDRLPAGNYQLRVDGSQGLTNITGAAVTADSTSFTVSGPTAGTAGNPLVWTHNPQTDAPPTSQALGTLFPAELAAGVNIVRPEGTGSNRNDDQFDDYSFSVLQSGRYALTFSGVGLPGGVTYQLFDQQGNVVPLTSVGGGALAFTRLTAGSYVLRVGNWPASSARSIDYQIQLKTLFQGDDAVPLFSGAAPAIGLRLVTAFDTGGSGGSGSGGGIGGIGGGGIGGGGIGGGISTVGSSSTSINPIDRPNDYITGPVGMSLSRFTSSNGVVIAIPTILSDSDAGLGPKLQVARSWRRISAAGDGLSPSRLSEFADGPMGRSDDDRSGIDTDLSAVRRLSRLIDSAVAQKRATDDSQQSPATNRPAAWIETTDVGDQEANLDAEGEIVPAEGDGGDSDHTTAIEAPQSKLSAQINKMSPAMNVNSQSVAAIDLAFIESAPAIDYQIDTVELQSVYLPDTVFAAGVGLLLTNAIMQGARRSAATDSRCLRLHFTSTNGLKPSRRND